MGDDFGGGGGPPGYSTALGLAATQVSHEADQNRSHSDLTWAAQFNQDMAQGAFDRQLQFRQTAYQDTVADLQKAGLNPMLAIHGATNAGGVQGASISPNTTYGGGPATENTAATMLAGAEADALRARADKDKADAEATRATYPVNIDKLRSDMNVANGLIEKMAAEKTHAYASAAQAEQQTKNLQALIPQIKATIVQMQGLTALQAAQYDQVRKQTSLTDEQIKNMQQIVRAQLPIIEAHIKQLELPGRGMTAAANSSFLGAWRAAVRAIAGQHD